jgi:hypothetical protein
VTQSSDDAQEVRASGPPASGGLLQKNLTESAPIVHDFTPLSPLR